MTPTPSLSPPRRSFPFLNAFFAIVALYLFLCAINVMGSGLKGIGKQSDWLETIIAQGQNPLFALFGAVLVTSIVQSSSFTTSLIITMVAAGQMPIETAVFAAFLAASVNDVEQATEAGAIAHHLSKQLDTVELAENARLMGLLDDARKIVGLEAWPPPR